MRALRCLLTACSAVVLLTAAPASAAGQINLKKKAEEAAKKKAEEELKKAKADSVKKAQADSSAKADSAKAKGGQTAAAAGAPAITTEAPKQHAYFALGSGLAALPSTNNHGTVVLAPLSLELGFVPHENFEVGASFDYAQSTSMGCADCQARRWRGAVLSRGHLIGIEHVLDPWLGGGFGTNASPFRR